MYSVYIRKVGLVTRSRSSARRLRKDIHHHWSRSSDAVATDSNKKLSYHRDSLARVVPHKPYIAKT